jgi:2-dehydropantoate 2-reductase
MRIAAMAAGAVGGYFGARLAAAGHDVHFIARGAHLAALRQGGLKIDSVHGDLSLKPVNATDDPARVGPVEVVLFAVKLWDTEAAAEQARPLVGPDSRVITLQNGIDSVERMQPILGDAVIGGAAYIATVIAEPGRISHTSQFARLRIGRDDGRVDPVLDGFVTAAQAAGIDIAVPASIETERWEKFVFLVAMSALTAATRQPIGPILADPDTFAWFAEVMREVAAIARAKGVALAPDFVEGRLRFVTSVPPGMKASMAHDLERGNRLELDWLSGKVVALGRELGIPTPANEAAYRALKLWRMGTAPAPGLTAAA